jgi:hypothetical protein
VGRATNNLQQWQGAHAQFSGWNATPGRVAKLYALSERITQMAERDF